jgi:hypothetical protein
MILHRMTENLTEFAPMVRRDGRGVQLYLNGVTCAVDVMPGFLVRTADSVLGQEHGWIESSPQRHDALFFQANAGCGAKFPSISQFIKIWRFAGFPPLEISGLYVDVMLATSDMASGIKSYGQCLSDFFNALVEQKIRGLADPAGGGAIIASRSSDALERVFDAAKAASAYAQAALEAQAHGDNAEANRRWEAIFKRGISRRRQLQSSTG